MDTVSQYAYGSLGSSYVFSTRKPDTPSLELSPQVAVTAFLPWRWTLKKEKPGSATAVIVDSFVVEMAGVGVIHAVLITTAATARRMIFVFIRYDFVI